MTDYIAVLPSIHKPYTDACLEGLKFDPASLIVVDNIRENRGVAASWNIGALQVINEQRDWLILLSAGVRFGEAGGLDFLTALDERPSAHCVEAGKGIGWHLLGIHRRALEAVGLFDENFYPGYWEDIDWSYRFRLAHRPPPYGGQVEDPFWPKVDVDSRMESTAHATKIAGVPIPVNELISYYCRKWHGMTGLERFTAPFGREDLPVTFCPPRSENW